MGNCKWKSLFHCLCPTAWIKGAYQVALVVKSLPANTGDTKDTSLIPGLGRSPGVENGNSLQYSCLSHAQMGLVGYMSMGPQRIGPNWVTEHTPTPMCLSHTFIWEANQLFPSLTGPEMERKISPGRYVPRTQLPNLDDLDNEIWDFWAIDTCMRF